MTKTIAPPAALAAKFRKLADQWKEETLFLSSTTAICTHPAYQRIIGMGPPALPLILEDLQRDSAQWFWALKAITEEDPVIPEDCGNIPAMKDAWLRWGRVQGWIT